MRLAPIPVKLLVKGEINPLSLTLNASRHCDLPQEPEVKRWVTRRGSPFRSCPRGERTEQLIDLCFEQRNALLPLGEFARLGEFVNQGRALAEELGDKRRLGWALAYQSHQQSVLGELARSIEAGERACAIAETVGALGLRVVANHYLGQALCWSGDPRRAAAAEGAAITLLKGAPSGERFGLATLPG